jgi:hypothetical protein
VGADGAVVDDAAATRRLRLHHPERRLRAEEGGVEIDADDVEPLGGGQVLEVDPGGTAAGVVEQDVDAAERRAGLGEERLDVRWIGQVAGDGEQAGAERFAGGDRRLQSLGATACDGDGVADAGQAQGGGFADAAATAGNDGDAVQDQAPSLS